MAVASAALLSGCGQVGPPPKDFATEDAVVAMRVQEGGEDSSYLVLFSADGRSRAIELDGDEDDRVSWTKHGVTTSDRDHDYVIDGKGLSGQERTSDGESVEQTGEWFRVQVGKGTLAGFSGADGSSDSIFTYIDGATSKATTEVESYAPKTAAAVCDDHVFAPGRGTGTKAFEDDSDSVPEAEWDRAALVSIYPRDGVDVKSTLEPSSLPMGELPCVDGIVYEAWENNDADQHIVRTWNTAKGTSAAEAAIDHEIVYPGDAAGQIGGPSAVAVKDGRLVWVVENTIWSASRPSHTAGEVQAREIGRVGGYIGLDAEALTYSSKAAYSVTNESDLRERHSKYDSDVWTELTGLTLLRTDLATGKESAALEFDVDDVDFPTKNVSVTALAINPEWLADQSE
ncbi:hypothetical protein ACFWQC_14345 [Nocardioides sp. NPDC058538]|uniref:hypothetical protein n=1 Tax=Nocardioides sp. NPDC058538 TaxID=3346542 RepID=UPI00364F6EAF